MKSLILSTVAASILAAGAMAQTTEAGLRRENQQDRVAQGVKSGQLTAGETARLENREAAINHEVRADRSLNGGKLTGQEKRIVNGQQNRMSKQIYQDKHNAATAHYGNNRVGSRRENQQDRIANGIASGRMTAGQAARTEKGESATNQEVRTDRSLNGGRLTPGERTHVNGQQNRMSNKIYTAKHS
ncbi:MAG TPA: hypothetical protein VNY05_36055 [Candidatus Acidoferrales bacterium]|jgi:hypothetical protein|nr:hypothetical protein [Candidatus Acidoferrales bacterium]